MTPPPKPHDKKETEVGLKNADCALTAVDTCRSNLSKLVAGPVWNHRTRRGEFEVNGCLLLDDVPVTVLHFSPEDGSLLPKGLHALTAADDAAIAKVKAHLSSVVTSLDVLDGAEFREPELCWAVPLAQRGRIVGHLKVTANGESIMPDKKLADDIAKL